MCRQTPGEPLCLPHVLADLRSARRALYDAHRALAAAPPDSLKETDRRAELVRAQDRYAAATSAYETTPEGRAHLHSAAAALNEAGEEDGAGDLRRALEQVDEAIRVRRRNVRLPEQR
jgi:hypothetical protein